MLRGLPPWPRNQSWKLRRVEGSDHTHRPLVVHQPTHDRTGAQGQGIAQLVDPGELRGREEGLEAIEGCPEWKAEIKLAKITATVHKQVGVVLGEEVVDGPDLGHQGKEVGVVVEKDMQSHLDVIAIRVLPAAHLAAHERPGLIEIDLVTGIHQIHRRRKAGQPRSNDGDLHTFCLEGPRLYGGDSARETSIQW